MTGTKNRSLLIFTWLMLVVGTAAGVEVSVPGVTGSPGETVTVSVHSDDLTGLGIISFQLRLNYNPSVLAVTGATVSETIADGWPEPALNSIFPGQVILAAAGGTPLEGTGDLVRLSFQVLPETAASGSPLHLDYFLFNQNLVPVIRSGLFQYAQDLGVRVRVPSLNVAAGDTVLLPVLVDDLSGRGVYSYQFRLNYDPQNLIADSVIVRRTLTGDAGWNYPTLNLTRTGSIGLAAAGATVISGGGELVRFRFIVTQDAAGVSSIGSSEFIFNEGVPTVLTESGEVTVRPPDSIPVRLSNVTGMPNASVTVPVIIDTPLDGLGIVAIQFAVNFDPDLLSPRGVSRVGTMAEGWGQLEFNHQSQNRLAVALAGSSPLNGQGKLVNLIFDIASTARGITDLVPVDFIFNQGPPASPPVVLEIGSLSIATDDVPPEILSGPSLDFVEATSAQIAWVTDELSNSIVVFGTDTTDAETFETKTMPDPVTDHFVILDQLQPLTTYYYRIGSQDMFGNLTVLLEYNGFTTESLAEVDSLPPVIIGNSARITGLQQTAATVEWDTDDPATSLLRFWSVGEDTTTKSESHYTRAHAITLTGLESDQEYYFQAASEDVAGNRSAYTPVDSFTTSATADMSAPEISSVTAANVTNDKALISWVTSEEADGYVEYGQTADYGSQTPTSTGYDKEQEVLLFGLEAAVTYHYRVGSTDIAGNGPTLSGDHTFTTLATADPNPPIITSGPTVEGATDKSATVAWTTNELSTSKVKYGPANPAFTDSVEVLEYTTDHRVLVTGLEPDTEYRYTVESTDISGNTKSLLVDTQLLGIEFTFQTEEFGDILPPVIISGPLAVGVTNTTATIVWATDEPANAEVEYGLTDQYGLNTVEAKAATIHKVKLAELVPDTTYHYQVSSTDMAGNRVTTTIDYTFKTKEVQDTSPPVILEGPVTKGVTDTTAIIVWITDEPSNTFVEFGPTESLGELWGFAEEVTAHKVTLTGLEALTDYFYAVNSTDAAGNNTDTKNISLTGDYVFSFKTRGETDAEPPVIVAGPLVTGRNDKTVQVRWLTDELCDSYVWFGTSADTSAWSVKGKPAHQTDHKVTLTNLDSGTQYYYRVRSTDLSLNTKTSQVAFVFKTRDIADIIPPVIVAGPILAGKTNKTAVIKWETDELSYGKVEFGTSMDYGEEVIDPVYRFKHNITLTNLERGTEYYFRITSTDMADNSIIDPAARPLPRALQPPGGGGSFTTDTEPDTRSPLIIAGPTLVARTNSAVTLEWETDEVADSRVDYGGTTDYEAVYEDGTDVKTHRVTLTNLDASTIYNYRVASTDPSNNPAVESANAVVTTEAERDLIPPTISEGPTVLYKTNNRATIWWKTDEPAASRIDFGLSLEYDDYKEDIDFVNEHKVTITNLSATSTYHYKATTRDISGNDTESSDLTFTTEAAADISAPRLVGSVSNGAVGNETAEVLWKTDEISDSFIHYGTNQSIMGLNAGSEEDVLEHKLTLSGLSAGTIYYYRVGSTDPAGNTAENLAMGSFTTLTSADSQAPAKPTGLTASPSPTSVTLNWTANPESDLAGYNIQRAAGASGSFSTIATLVTANTYTDPGLTLGNLYRYRISASDRFGNVSSYSEVISVIPSAIELAEFTAVATAVGAVVKWAVLEEKDLRGFRLLRSENEVGEYRAITPKNRPIPSGRRNYKYIDRTAEVGKTYYYKLEVLSLNGDTTSFGPLALDMASNLPRQFALSQNYPNPFNPETVIHYALPVAGWVELEIYDIMGHRVRRLVSERVEAGYHQVRWDGRDDRGGDVASGVYFYRIQAVDAENPEASFRAIKKMVVLK